MGRLIVAVVALLAALVASGARAESWKLVNANSPYPEGPLWFQGRLHYVEYAAHTVMTWDGHDNRVLWKQDGCGPSGLAPYRDGLLITCYDSNTLVLIDPAGHTELTIDQDAAGQPFKGPNDFAPDGKGGLYVSMSGTFDVAAPIEGKVYHLAPGGRLTPVAADIHYANGMALTDGGRTLLVAEMLAQRVLRFEVNPDGTLGRRFVHFRLEDIVPTPEGADGYYGPDGLKVDDRGNIYVAQNGGGAVLVVDPAGKKLLRRLPVGSRYVTNLGFGPSEDTIYVTAANDPWHPPYPGVVYEVANR